MLMVPVGRYNMRKTLRIGFLGLIFVFVGAPTVNSCTETYIGFRRCYDTISTCEGQGGCGFFSQYHYGQDCGELYCEQIWELAYCCSCGLIE